MTGIDPDNLVPVSDKAEGTNGFRFNLNSDEHQESDNDLLVPDSGGKVTFGFEFHDRVATRAGATYEARYRVGSGSVYFLWKVTVDPEPGYAATEEDMVAMQTEQRRLAEEAAARKQAENEILQARADAERAKLEAEQARLEAERIKAEAAEAAEAAALQRERRRPGQPRRLLRRSGSRPWTPSSRPRGQRSNRGSTRRGWSQSAWRRRPPPQPRPRGRRRQRPPPQQPQPRPRGRRRRKGQPARQRPLRGPGPWTPRSRLGKRPSRRWTPSSARRRRSSSASPSAPRRSTSGPRRGRAVHSVGPHRGRLGRASLGDTSAFEESGSAWVADDQGGLSISWTGKTASALIGVTGLKRAFAAAAVVTARDDLQTIKGVGPFIEEKLNALGITTFRQVANMTPELEDQVNTAIEFFPGRVRRDKWAKQADGLMRK